MTAYCFETINWSPYFDAPTVPIQRLIEAASNAGFEWISFDEQLLDAARVDGTTPSAIKAMLDSAGLRTLAVHSLAISDDGRADLELAEPLITAASTLGAPYLHCGVRSGLSEDVLASAKAIARFARESDVSVAIEFLPFLPVASIADTRAVVRGCQDEGAGMVVDSWHFFHGPDDWEALESLSPSEIAYIQFDDHPALASSDLLDETTGRRVMPGQGEFDLDRFARTLQRLGYAGVVGLELLSEESRRRPPDRVAGELLAASRPYWNIPDERSDQDGAPSIE